MSSGYFVDSEGNRYSYVDANGRQVGEPSIYDGEFNATYAQRIAQGLTFVDTGAAELPTWAEVENDVVAAFQKYLKWNAVAGWPQSVPAALAHPQAAYLVAEFANNTGHAGIEAAGVVGARLGLDPRAVEAEQAKRLGIQQATSGGGFLKEVGELLAVKGPLGITAGMALAAAGAYAYAGASAGGASALDAGMNVYDVSGWSPTGGASAFDAGMSVYDVSGWSPTGGSSAFDAGMGVYDTTNFAPVYDIPTLPNITNLPAPATPGTVIQTPPAVNVPATPGPLDTVKSAIGTINQVKSAAGAIAAAMGVGGAVGANSANVRPVQTVRPLANTGAGADTAANVLPIAALAAALLFLKG